MVAIPIARSACSVTLPTPHRRDTGRGARKAAVVPGGTATSPSGFPRSEAIFAAILQSATPAETVSPVPVPDLALHPSCNVLRLAVQGAAPRDVEEGLVEGERLDERCVAAVDGEDRPGELPVALEARREEDALGAEPSGLHGGHRRADAEAPGLVAGGADHPSSRGSPHDDRAAPQDRSRRAARPRRRRRRGRDGGWTARRTCLSPRVGPKRGQTDMRESLL